VKTHLSIALLALTLTSACGGSPRGKDATSSSGAAPVAGDSTGSTRIPEAAPQATVSPEIAGFLEDGLREAAAGNLDAARRAYESAAAADDSAPEPLYNLGVLAERQGNDVEARRYYKQALDARPEFGPAVTGIAQIMLRKGDAAAALSFAQERLEKAPRQHRCPERRRPPQAGEQ
jgi:tetratricopeptide (TPR) repeat protein